MSTDLRASLIRLASSNPELRPHLLPLLKEAAPDLHGDADLLQEIDLYDKVSSKTYREYGEKKADLLRQMESLERWRTAENEVADERLKKVLLRHDDIPAVREYLQGRISFLSMKQKVTELVQSRRRDPKDSVTLYLDGILSKRELAESLKRSNGGPAVEQYLDGIITVQELAFRLGIS